MNTVISALLFLLLSLSVEAAGINGIGFQSKISRHPALITIKLRKALDKLVDSPASILKMGIKTIEGDQKKYRLILRYILRKSEITDISFHGYRSMDVAAGRLNGITLTVSNISMKPLFFKNLSISLHGISFDIESLFSGNLFVMKKIESFSFKTVIADKVLNDIVGSGFSLSIQNGQLHITTTVKLLMFQMTARVAGTLFVRDEESICFHTDSLNVGNLPFVDFFKSRVSARLNPLFSLEKYMGKARQVVDTVLTNVSAEEGFIVISGEGTISLSR